jgi:hypothetical protein
MSGDKSGGAQKSLNYYGTIAGALGWGPLDWLNAIVANGNYLFQGNLTIMADVTDLTGALLDPAMLAPGGYVKLYRGTETQPTEPALPRHPAMRGTAWLIARHLFFGQDSGQPPNLQVIAGRIPRVSTSIVAAIDNIADDGQVNPIAFLAEFLLDERGMGWPQSLLVADTWLAAAHWCAQDQARRDYTFCSPLVTDQSSFADLVKALLDPFNGFLRWTRDGKLACCIYEWGLDPGGLTVLDERHLSAAPKFVAGDWTQVKTETLVSFVDRNYEFQENTVLVPNARAQQIRQLDDQGRLDRKHVTRIAQAHRQGTEYNCRAGTAPSTGTLKVRQPFVTALSVGDKIKVNVNPEPGGAALAQLCRVEKIVQDRTDEAVVTVMTDALLPASAYTPVWTTPTAPEALCSPLVHVLGVPLPLAYTGWPPALAFLATRPSADIVGFQVFFAAAATDPFAELGTQGGFAVRATLAANIISGAASANFTETDGLTAPDAGLAANTPAGNGAAAADDTLLALLATLDSYGRIALDSDDVPIMEFVSIVDRTFVSGTTHIYSVLRGRLGTVARAWTTAATVWIVPRVNLTAWEHTQLPALLGSTIYARLVAYNAAAVSDTSVPEADLNLPPLAKPTGLAYVSGSDSNFARAQPFQGTVRAFAVRVNWTPPTVKPDYYEWSLTSTDSDAAATVGAHYRADTAEVVLVNTLLSALYFRVRTVLHDVVSAWAGGGTSMSGLWGYPAKDMVDQASDAVAVSGISTGSGASVRKVLARFQTQVSLALAGGANYETFNIDLTNRGFSTAPEVGLVSVDLVGLVAFYNLGSSSSTNAVLYVYRADGGNIAAGTRGFTAEFTEYA